jgi:parallel beta-helix repeat protein
MPASNVLWMPPLTRFPTLWPGQTGVPGTDHDRGERMHCTGEVFYVDPNFPGVSDQRDGTSPTSPLQTVAAALTHCQPYRGDVIAVMSSAYWRHADQTLGYALPIQEEVVVTIPGVRIVGLFPSGDLGVPWRVTQNGGIAITVRAIDVLVEGFCFYEPTFTTPIGIRAEWGGLNSYHGDNLTVRHCFFDGTLDYGIQLDFSWYAQIYGNIFQEIDTAAVFNLNVIGDPDYAQVYDNTFMNCAAAIKLTDSDDCFIYNNRIYGNAAGVANFIDLTGGARNFVADNWLGCTTAQYALGGTCAGSATDSWVRNHCTDAETITNNP